MKASETSLRNLIEGSKQFKVPLYQRPYSWDSKNWEALWNDLVSLYNDETEGSHFLGPIVTLSELGTPDGISPFIVIDGQQRLTTLTLLLMALRDHLRKENLRLSEKLQELYLINKFQDGEAFYKVLPTQADRSFYQNIVQNGEIEKQGRIYEAYRFFYKLIEKGNDSNSFDLHRLTTTILERLNLVSITLNEDDNPYLIFESLNYKGAPLTQADLIRNYFFLKLPKDQGIQDKVYSTFWLPMQEEFKVAAGDKYLDEITLAFWQYLRKDGSPVKLNQIYQVFKQEFEKKKLELNAEKELNTLIQFAKYYRFIHFPTTEKEMKLARWFKRFKQLDFSTCYPFLLNLYHDYTEKKISLTEFNDALRYVESYFIRRLLCGMPSNAIDKVFIVLYRQVREQWTGDLVSSLRQVLIGLQGTQVWPEDSLLKIRIVEERIYTDRRSARIKLILMSLAEGISKEQVNAEKLTVEHVMPQTLTDEWKAMLGANSEELHQKWRHTLGNLTLLHESYNSESSNRPFVEKLNYLGEKSSFALNHYFRNVNAWNAAEIKQRGQHLAELAVKVWPR